MTERERPRPMRPRSSSDAASGAAEGERLRTESEDLLRSADEAIERALSSDSQHFLRATAQTSGQ